jgi:hypothetical protein
MVLGYHLAEIVADGEVFVQGEDDFAAWYGAFEELEDFDAEVCVVVEVDDVGGEFCEEAFDLAREAGVLVGEFEPVEAAGGIDVVVFVMGLGEDGAEFFGGGGAVAAEEPGFAAGLGLDAPE